MLRKLRDRLKAFFFPPPGATRFQRILPYAVLGLVTLFLLTGGVYAWDYTNSPVFCGTSCHTMPPEYSAYQVSPHARVDCVECHIGRGFVATRITRKAGDIKHIVSLLFKKYEYPIHAGELRPARDTCERCHYPAKFSDDSLRQKISFENDKDNTLVRIYLAMRTGGGSQREGLGRGIHWHGENEVWYAAADELDQDIPYIRVIGPDGEETVYTALDSDLSDEELAGWEQKRMDCITCHNRISHNILPPSRAVDQALARQQISTDIPYIRYVAVEMLNELTTSTTTTETAIESIRGIGDYYEREYPDFYAENQDKVDQAVEVLVRIYQDTVFQEQKVNWQDHPNNLGHKDWPGCFRCHDGQHVSQSGQAIQLECNLCHAIPQVATENVIEPRLPLATGLQPQSHFSTHWIALHRESFDQTCQACHNVENPGGTDNTSFCSNSACHGTAWQFAGLDAPGLAAILAADQPVVPETPGFEPGAGSPTFESVICPLFASKCTGCHSAALATGGLVLDTYDSVMRGGNHGPVIIPGDPEGSPMVKRQREGHFATFTADELALVIEWILNGAPAN